MYPKCLSEWGRSHICQGLFEQLCLSPGQILMHRGSSLEEVVKANKHCATFAGNVGRLPKYGEGSIHEPAEGQ